MGRSWPEEQCDQNRLQREGEETLEEEDPLTMEARTSVAGCPGAALVSDLYVVQGMPRYDRYDYLDDGQSTGPRHDPSRLHSHFKALSSKSS